MCVNNRKSKELKKVISYKTMYNHRDDISKELKEYEKKIKEKNCFFQYCIKCCNKIKNSIHYSIISDYIKYFRNLIQS